MRNFLKLTIVLLLFSSCATKTTIIMPNEEIYIVKAKHDALVMIKKDDVEMTVNNQGKPSALMQIISMLFIRAPEAVDAGD